MLKKITSILKWIFDFTLEGVFLGVMCVCAFMFGQSVWLILNCFLCNNCN